MNTIEPKTLFSPLQKFVDSINSSVRETLSDDAWRHISQLWQYEFSRLDLSNELMPLDDDSTISHQTKWEKWYNDQAFKLENALCGHPQFKLPNLPTHYVSSFPSKDDRMQIVKEQLVMSAIDGALSSICNPEPIITPLLKFFDIDTYVCPNQELYLRECLKEAKGFEMLSIYHQLISILIEKCSHSRSRKYVDELDILLDDARESVKVEEIKVEDSIILLLDIATRIKNLKNAGVEGYANVEGYAGSFVKRAKELSVVSEISTDLVKKVEEMAQPYIKSEDDFMYDDLNLDSIVYSDELKSNRIIQ